MPVFNHYCYEPLSFPESVRLILLDPAPTQSAQLSCLIIQRRRRTTTAGYSAVSYTWGKRELTCTLEVRCGSDTSYLRVSANLDALLRAFRARDVPVCLWIDAICINQHDEMEKAQQIPLMGRIYSEADQVRIWLGAADSTIAGIFAFFRKASQRPIVAQTQPEVARDVVFLMKKTIVDDGISGLSLLFEFFDRPWFSRRWVIQEAGLSRKAVVHCGSYSIPLQTMSTAAERVQSLDLSWYQVNMVAKLPTLKANMDILELLWYYHAACCVDPRDRVAALFGLVPDIASQLRYNVHWSELYRQLAAFVLEFGCNNARLQLMLHLFEFG
ncbi:heterokaryon incompatibility protein-domain-containing protein, partial [Plectosphaerella plurivora]